MIAPLFSAFALGVLAWLFYRDRPAVVFRYETLPDGNQTLRARLN